MQENKILYISAPSSLKVARKHHVILPFCKLLIFWIKIISGVSDNINKTEQKKKNFNCYNIYLSVTICVNSKVLYFMLIFVTYLSPLFATVDPIRNNRTAASCKCKKHCFINLLQSSKNAHFSSQFLRYHNDCTSLFLNLHIFKEPQTGFFSLLVFSE